MQLVRADNSVEIKPGDFEWVTLTHPRVEEVEVHLRNRRVSIIDANEFDILLLNEGEYPFHVIKGDYIGWYHEAASNIAGTKIKRKKWFNFGKN